MTIDKRLRKVLAELNALAGELEDGGFEAQQRALDEAQDRIEPIAEQFEALGR